MREVREGEAVYYLGETRIADKETLTFEITIATEGAESPLRASLQQQFFVSLLATVTMTLLAVSHGQASFGSADYGQLSANGHEHSRRRGTWLTARQRTKLHYRH